MLFAFFSVSGGVCRHTWRICVHTYSNSKCAFTPEHKGQHFQPSFLSEHNASLEWRAT